MLSIWLRLHYWLGVASCIGLVMWGVSGISHPIMTHLQPVPKAFQAPSEHHDLLQAAPLVDVLNQHKITRLLHVSLAQLDNQSYYRVSVSPNEPAKLFDVKTGQERVNGDQEFAAHLAAHFTAESKSDVKSIRWVHQFDEEYLPVNRLLPVWRVEFHGDDHLRAFIDTEQIRLSTLIDERRAILTQLFRFGHNWAFLERCTAFQTSLLTGLLICIIASALTGILLFFKLKQANRRLANKPLKKWHRYLGFSVSLATLLFASSGIFHLIISAQQQSTIMNTAQMFNTNTIEPNTWNQIATDSIAKLDLIGFQQQAFWLVASAKSPSNSMPTAQVANLHHENHGQSTKTAKLVPANQASYATGEQLATTLACHQLQTSSCKVISIREISQFENAYGFIFKRLPVYEVAIDLGKVTKVYIELATTTVSTVTRQIDGLEGFAFAYLHKWSWPFLNKEVRDWLVGLMALANIIVGGLGILLFIRQRKTENRA